VAVKSKYFSRRAIGLHVAMVFWVALCGAAAWWQVGRAIGGNSLSYMYMIEWPVFGVLGVLGWYALINQDKVTAYQEQARREYEEKMRNQARRAREATLEEEDPTLAAYNDHLADLSTKSKKRLWGH
jgi:DNA-binding transcriptional regulator of glucitol operon